MSNEFILIVAWKSVNSNRLARRRLARLRWAMSPVLNEMPSNTTVVMSMVSHRGSNIKILAKLKDNELTLLTIHKKRVESKLIQENENEVMMSFGIHNNLLYNLSNQRLKILDLNNPSIVLHTSQCRVTSPSFGIGLWSCNGRSADMRGGHLYFLGNPAPQTTDVHLCYLDLNALSSDDAIDIKSISHSCALFAIDDIDPRTVWHYNHKFDISKSGTAFKTPAGRHLERYEKYVYTCMAACGPWLICSVSGFKFKNMFEMINKRSSATVDCLEIEIDSNSSEISRMTATKVSHITLVFATSIFRTMALLAIVGNKILLVQSSIKTYDHLETQNYHLYSANTGGSEVTVLVSGSGRALNKFVFRLP